MCWWRPEFCQKSEHSLLCHFICLEFSTLRPSSCTGASSSRCGRTSKPFSSWHTGKYLLILLYPGGVYDQLWPLELGRKWCVPLLGPASRILCFTFKNCVSLSGLHQMSELAKWMQHQSADKVHCQNIQIGDVYFSYLNTIDFSPCHWPNSLIVF